MKIAAVDRDSQRILATCDFQLNVQGLSNVTVFKNSLVIKFVERGQCFLPCKAYAILDALKAELLVRMAASEFELEIVKVEALDDDLLEIEIGDVSWNFSGINKFLKDEVKIEDGQIII